MKLKYYLKGLGIGMIISAALLGALYYFNTDTASMTDAQIIERARQLGMVEDRSLDHNVFEAVDFPVSPEGEAVDETGEEVSEEEYEGFFGADTADEEPVGGTWSDDSSEDGAFEEETPVDEE